MKERATVVCTQNNRLLLVSRGRSRWSLPGGTIRRSESPLEAARRELFEETALAVASISFLFEFGGHTKRHHVFLAELPADVAPVASDEITKCRWFRPARVASVVTSVPTREIVRLLDSHINVTIAASHADATARSDAKFSTLSG